MPYTPPSQSPSSSPDSSRNSSSTNGNTSSSASTSRLLSSNNPPRSATYLHKHRRTPSIGPPAQNSPAGKSASTVLLRSHSHQAFADPRVSGSVHQSPPPTDNGLSMIPPGAVISPPDSSQNSSDDELSPIEGGRRRGRNLGSLEEQLKESLMNITQHRSSSPDSSVPRKLPSPTELQINTHRKISHSRSTSDSSFLQEFNQRQESDNVSDYEDDAYRIAPPMVRKKSGELVKSSLKTPNRSRPSSMPSTPTFPKAVHFDSHIEHVRHFLHSEKPSAVSAGSSPVESHDGESEFPFFGDEPIRAREPPFEWEIVLPNFPKDLNARKHLPVRMERVYLSTDNKNLIGTVAVANLSFQKSVVVRFTLDYWQTTSEVSADYNNDVRRKQREEGIDRFTFNIKLADQANLDNKILFFCVRYLAAGQEHWDNNNGFNFQVDFKKKAKPQNGKPGLSRQASTLPRSKPSPHAAKPRSMPNFDDLDSFDGMFSHGPDIALPQPILSRVNPKPMPTIDTASPARRANPSGNAFGNRYDFGASLSAAIKAANTTLGPKRSGLDRKNIPEPLDTSFSENPYFKFGNSSTELVKEPKVKEIPPVNPATLVASRALSTSFPEGHSSTPLDSPSNTGAGPPEVFRPDTFMAEKPSMGSSSYRELLDNYCFFGSVKSSPQMAQGNDAPEKKALETNTNFLSATVFNVGHKSSAVSEQGHAPAYVHTPPNGSPQSLSGSHRPSGAVSPIPLNIAGYHHRRKASGAFRFEAPTAIC